MTYTVSSGTLNSTIPYHIIPLILSKLAIAVSVNFRSALQFSAFSIRAFPIVIGVRCSPYYCAAVSFPFYRPIFSGVTRAYSQTLPQDGHIFPIGNLLCRLLDVPPKRHDGKTSHFRHLFEPKNIPAFQCSHKMRHHSEIGRNIETSKNISCSPQRCLLHTPSKYHGEVGNPFSSAQNF